MDLRRKYNSINMVKKKEDAAPKAEKVKKVKKTEERPVTTIADGRRTRHEMTLEKALDQLTAEKLRTEKLTEEVKSLKRQLQESSKNMEDLKDELKDAKATLALPETIEKPKKGTPYWYIRSCFGPERFDVLQDSWTNSFFDRCRLVHQNVYMDEFSACAVCREMNKQLDRL